MEPERAKVRAEGLHRIAYAESDLNRGEQRRPTIGCCSQRRSEQHPEREFPAHQGKTGRNPEGIAEISWGGCQGKGRCHGRRPWGHGWQCELCPGVRADIPACDVRCKGTR